MGSKISEMFPSIPMHMDYRGQRLAEQIFQVVIITFAVIGFFWGYAVEHFGQTMYVVLAGFLLSCLLTLPPWGFYRRNPLPWRAARKVQEGSRVADGGKRKGK
uniref:signal peptidase complex subunit 1 n=1 Tax=Myxine glutinosa TaxID=7769 RepID=UPI00358F1C0B